MGNNEIIEKLKQLEIEDFIWMIYILIIILSFYSNKLEKDYFINNNLKSKDTYRKIMILIFGILNIVYFYFLNDSYKSINNYKSNDSKKKKDLNNLSFVASLLICISGIILLYIAINDNDLDVELAFN